MERHIPETSRKAFHKKENVLKRESHKDTILNFLEKHPTSGHTIRQIATHTHLGYRPTQKRVSDLYKEGRICISGTDLENDHEVNQYKFISRRIVNTNRKSRHQLLLENLKINYPKIYMDLLPKVEEQYQNLRSA